MTTATGDFAINFAALGNADPYTNANLTAIDAGTIAITSGLLKPSGAALAQFGERRRRYSGAMQAGAIIRAYLEIGTAANDDLAIAGIYAADGSGYELYVQNNATTVGIRTINAALSTAGLISGTAAFANGDVAMLELNQSTHTLTAYKRLDSGVGGYIQIGAVQAVDTTYTVGLAFGFALDAENANATTVKSFAGDGIATGTPGDASGGLASATAVTPDGAASVARSVSVTLKNATGTLLNTVSRRFWTRSTLDAAAVDGGAGGLSVVSNGVGVFALTGLSVLAGAGWLTYKDPSDDLNCHTVPVIFV